MGLDQYIRAKIVHSEQEYDELEALTKHVTAVDKCTQTNYIWKLQNKDSNVADLVSSAQELSGYIYWTYVGFVEVCSFRKCYAVQDWFSEQVLEGTHDCRPVIIPEYIMNDFIEKSKGILEAFRKKAIEMFATAATHFTHPLWEYESAEVALVDIVGMPRDKMVFERNCFEVLRDMSREQRKQVSKLWDRLWDQVSDICEECEEEINQYIPVLNIFRNIDQTYWPGWWIVQLADAVHAILEFKARIHPGDYVVWTYCCSW